MDVRARQQAYLRSAGPVRAHRDSMTPARLRPADIPAACLAGWRDFLAKPSHNILLALIYPIAGIAIIWTVSGAAPQLLWPLVSGFVLLGPVASIGLLEISRRRECGEQPQWRHVATVFSGPANGAALRIAITLIAIFGGWIASAQVIHRFTLGSAGPGEAGVLVERLFGTAQGWALLVVGNGMGFVFAVTVLAIGTFSIPLVLEGERSARRAMARSARVVIDNPYPMALFGAVVGSGLLAGAALLLVGLAVALPVFAHATWHLYRRAFAGHVASR